MNCVYTGMMPIGMGLVPVSIIYVADCTFSVRYKILKYLHCIIKI